MKLVFKAPGKYRVGAKSVVTVTQEDVAAGNAVDVEPANAERFLENGVASAAKAKAAPKAKPETK